MEGQTSDLSTNLLEHDLRRQGSSSPLMSVLGSSPLVPYHSELELKSKLSDFKQSVFNGVNVLAGVGILSLPFSLKQSGWVMGLGFLVYFCMLTNYTGKLIGRCMALSEHKILSFSDLGFVSFGVAGQVLISCVLSIELLGALSIYVALMGDNLHKVFPSVDRNLLCLISTATVLPTCWTSKLAVLSNLSVIGIVATTLLLVVLVETGFVTPDTYHTGSFYSIDWAELEPFDSKIPMAIGIIMSGFAGHAVFPSIYESMADKERFPRLMDAVYITCFTLYGSMAVLGYLLFRGETQEEITLNLYDVAGKSIAVKTTMWLIIINPFTKFALTLNPLAQLLEALLLPETLRSKTRKALSLCLRSTLAILSLLLAVVLPSFAFICSFVGAFCSFIVSAIFPICCYLKLFPDLTRWQWLWNSALIGINTVLCIIGTVAVIIS